VETVRTAFSWAYAQRDPDVIDLSATDRFMEMASARRMRVLPDIILAPDWIRRSPHPQAPPKDVRYMRDYLQALVRRYGPNGTFWAEHPELPRLPIREWQYWNEAHLPYQFTLGPGQDWREIYTRQLAFFHRTVKKADPKAKIVLGGLTNESWKYLAQLYRAGAGRWFDIATVHPYTKHPKGVLTIVRRFRAVMKRRHQSHKPVWITEFGRPASRGRSSSKNDLQTTDRGMARFLTEAYALLAKNRRKPGIRVARAYWYTWASAYRGDIFRYSGLFRYRPRGKVVEKPAFRAYVRTARRLEGCRKRRSGRCR